MSRDYYGTLAEAFDSAAQDYDRLYGSNRVMAWMRAQSLALLRSVFPTGGQLLEVGCGTGEEALALAAAGYRIVATDISPAMIRTAQAKPQPEGASSVAWRVLPAGQLHKLAQEHGAASFDGAYASFGALNCEPDLGPVAQALADLLRPGAPLVCSLMNRWCLWEIAWGLLHLRPREAFRRGGGWKVAGLASPTGSLSVPVRYYGPRDFVRAFKPQFSLQRMIALPVILPPPYQTSLVERHPRLFALLEVVECRVRGSFPFYYLGDHFVVVLIRRSATG